MSAVLALLADLCFKLSFSLLTNFIPMFVSQSAFGKNSNVLQPTSNLIADIFEVGKVFILRHSHSDILRWAQKTEQCPNKFR